jgi:DNA primase
MSELILDNKIIDVPIIDIVKQIKKELNNGKLKDIIDKHDNILVTCPHHKDGFENHPSCNIYSGDSDEIEYGMVNCFTCGFKGPLYHFVAECFGESDEFGKEWLEERFGDIFAKRNIILPPLETEVEKTRILDESILDKFEPWHPYMAQRKLSKEICEKFKVKYDPETQCLVFPVWDEYGKLTLLTRRSVLTKKFIIETDIEKPVYLLNYILKQNIKTVWVCESQINCLYAWTLGIPAIALFGTGSSHDYEVLNKSGIRNYILCFDGDEPGDNGVKKFIKNVNSDALMEVAMLPRGKDLNDLTEDEVFDLKLMDIYEWKKLQLDLATSKNKLS